MTKGPEAFRTISEAAEEVGVPQHVLRFWETKFSFIRPMKRAGGRRFYRPQDIAVLRGVRRLLHEQGYTIMGVQRLYREQGAACLSATADTGGRQPSGGAEPSVGASRAASSGQARLELISALEMLQEAKDRLDRALKR